MQTEQKPLLTARTTETSNFADTTFDTPCKTSLGVPDAGCCRNPAKTLSHPATLPFQTTQRHAVRTIAVRSIQACEVRRQTLIGKAGAGSDLEHKCRARQYTSQMSQAITNLSPCHAAALVPHYQCVDLMDISIIRQAFGSTYAMCHPIDTPAAI